MELFNSTHSINQLDYKIKSMHIFAVITSFFSIFNTQSFLFRPTPFSHLPSKK